MAPGGHFFATDHTMQRYKTAFYPPLVADLQNVGAWAEAGRKTATQRATPIWQAVLEEFKRPLDAPDIANRLAPYIEATTRAGGAAPTMG